MSVQQLKDIDQRTKDLVLGCIRIFNLRTMIPKEICYLCILFYYLIVDRFVYCGESIEITSSDEKNRKISDIATITDASGYRWLYVHGNVMINPKENTDVIVEWTIQVNVRYFIIGIDSSYLNFGDLSYEMYLAPWDDDDFNKGDLIKMEWNISKRQVVFYTNGKLSEKVVNNISMSKEYHLVVKIYTNEAVSGDGVKLIDFNINPQKKVSFYSN